MLAAIAQLSVVFQAKTGLVLKEPVVITVAVTNTTDRTLHVDFGDNRTGGVSVQIERPDRTLVTPRPPVRSDAGGFGPSLRVRIEPGTTFNHQVYCPSGCRSTLSATIY